MSGITQSVNQNIRACLNLERPDNLPVNRQTLFNLKVPDPLTDGRMPSKSVIWALPPISYLFQPTGSWYCHR
jgi:hypothetical protein